MTDRREVQTGIGQVGGSRTGVVSEEEVGRTDRTEV